MLFEDVADSVLLIPTSWKMDVIIESVKCSTEHEEMFDAGPDDNNAEALGFGLLLLPAAFGESRTLSGSEDDLLSLAPVEDPFPPSSPAGTPREPIKDWTGPDCKPIRKETYIIKNRIFIRSFC